MKTYTILTLVFAFGGEEINTSWPVESMDLCYAEAEQELQRENVREAICSTLRTDMIIARPKPEDNQHDR